MQTVPIDWRNATPTPQPSNPKPLALAQALANIREAGTAGVLGKHLRDRFRFIRGAMEQGNPLPLELASAGVMLRKEGKAYWYYIPDFL